VLQSRPVGNQPVLGLISKTGFLTTKGSLVRDILYPKDIKFKFMSDGYKFIAFATLICIVALFSSFPS